MIQMEWRVCAIGDEIFMVGKDICDALGIKHTTTALRQHCKNRFKLEEKQDDKNSRFFVDFSQKYNIRKNADIITESDFWELCTHSTKPEARVFRDWLFGTVLPSIRKTGKYEDNSITVPKPTGPIDLQQLLTQNAITAQLVQTTNALILNAIDIQKRQTIIEQEVQTIKEEVKGLSKQSEFGDNYFTVSYYFGRQGVKGSNQYFKKWGTLASRIAKFRNYVVSKWPHPKYPNGINMHHIDVLEEVYRVYQSGIDPKTYNPIDHETWDF